MGQKYKAVEKVNVYLTQADKDKGCKERRIYVKPFTVNGRDKYRYDGASYPGFRDCVDDTADACIILERTV